MGVSAHFWISFSQCSRVHAEQAIYSFTDSDSAEFLRSKHPIEARTPIPTRSNGVGWRKKFMIIAGFLQCVANVISVLLYHELTRLHFGAGFGVMGGTPSWCVYVGQITTQEIVPGRTEIVLLSKGGPSSLKSLGG